MLVYDNYKISHSGITQYRVFEGFQRKMKKNSLKNLLNYKQDQFELYASEQKEKLTRNLDERQSKRLKRYCNKLCYYSATRIFESKKSGKYKMKVAFLTLTAPQATTDSQFLKAFDGFLDYLRRTANCVYVWKKELGETNGKLHVHLIINNFIPFYIVSWKWKRLLINTGVNWPVNEKGKHTDSHYRIELPKSKKQVGAYIAKYLSKAYELPKMLGYVWGKSPIIDTCKEFTFMEGDFDMEQCKKVGEMNKIVGDNYVKHVCVDLLTVKDIAPDLFSLFESQYLEFCKILTLPQKFSYVE